MHHSTGQSSLFPHRRQTRISSSCSGLRCRRVGSSFSVACVRSPVLAPRYLGQKGRPIRSPNETPPPSGRYSTNAIFSPQKTMMTEETKTKNEAAIRELIDRFAKAFRFKDDPRTDRSFFKGVSLQRRRRMYVYFRPGNRFVRHPSTPCKRWGPRSL